MGQGLDLVIMQSKRSDIRQSDKEGFGAREVTSSSSEPESGPVNTAEILGAWT